MLGFYITLKTISFTTGEKISAIQNNIDAKNKQIEKFATLEKDTKEVNSRLSSIDKIIGSQMMPNNIIESISSKVGSTVILSTLQINQSITDPKAKTSSTPESLLIAMTGVAGDRSAAIEFKRALESDPKFTSITYSLSTNRTTSDTTNTISFTLNANYSTTIASTITK
jgi:hypothetical protein